MKERTKRVKRADGSSYWSKSKIGRWGTEGRARQRGRERTRDWTNHEKWNYRKERKGCGKEKQRNNRKRRDGGRAVIAADSHQRKEMKERGRVERNRGGWKVKGRKSGTRRHFMWGKPLKARRPVKKARIKGVYGCGKTRAKRRCRRFAVSERANVGSRGRGAINGIERRIKRKRRMGPERQRMEREAVQKEYVRRTVRGRKMKRGLPVRGQRTSTNGKTARRLNAKRG